MAKRSNINNLHGIAQFALFVTSYLPLFVLIVFRQISENSSFLNYGGITLASFQLFAYKFSLSFILVIVSIIGLFGYWQTLGNIEEVAKNGYPVTVKDVKNNNIQANHRYSYTQTG